MNRFNYHSKISDIFIPGKFAIISFGLGYLIYLSYKFGEPSKELRCIENKKDLNK